MKVQIKALLVAFLIPSMIGVGSARALYLDCSGCAATGSGSSLINACVEYTITYSGCSSGFCHNNEGECEVDYECGFLVTGTANVKAGCTGTVSTVISSCNQVPPPDTCWQGGTVHAGRDLSFSVNESVRCGWSKKFELSYTPLGGSSTVVFKSQCSCSACQ
jgi:hypothetical protein